MGCRQVCASASDSLALNVARALPDPAQGRVGQKTVERTARRADLRRRRVAAAVDVARGALVHALVVLSGR